MKKLNDNTKLYDIGIHSNFDNLIYELAEILEIDEAKTDNIYDEILDESIEVEKIVEQLCWECGSECSWKIFYNNIYNEKFYKIPINSHNFKKTIEITSKKW